MTGRMTDLDGDGIAETQGTRKGVLRGDFGTSLVNRKPVLEVIGERLPNTLILMVASEVIIILGALLVGIYSALQQYSFMDNLITALMFIGYSMPIFFIALISMYIFAVLFKRWGLPYLPTVGMFDPQVGKTTLQVLWHMILPVLSISLISFASYSRYIRSTMLEVMSQDYIRTAHVQGAAEARGRFYPCTEECLPADRHRGRAGPAPAAGRRGGHGAHLCLAGHGTAVPGPCRPRRHCRSSWAS